MTTTTPKLTPKLWKELAGLAQLGKPFERYCADFGTLPVLEAAGLVAPLGPLALETICAETRDRIAELTAAAHRALDKGDYSAVKSLMGTISYRKGLLEPEDEDAIWWAITDEGRAQLAAHEARKRKPVAGPKVAPPELPQTAAELEPK